MSFVYFGLQQSTSAMRALDFVHRCAACGKSTPSRVLAVGFGTGTAHYLQGIAESGSDAASAASLDLADDAARVGALARCAHCGARNRKAINAFLLSRGVRFAFTLIGTCWPALSFASDRLWVLAGVFGALSIGAGAAVIALSVRLWRAQLSRVKALELGAPTASPVDPRGWRRDLPGLEGILTELPVAAAVARGDSVRLRSALEQLATGASHAWRRDAARSVLDRLGQLRDAGLA